MLFIIWRFLVGFLQGQTRAIFCLHYKLHLMTHKCNFVNEIEPEIQVEQSKEFFVEQKLKRRFWKTLDRISTSKQFRIKRKKCFSLQFCILDFLFLSLPFSPSLSLSLSRPSFPPSLMPSLLLRSFYSFSQSCRF